MKKKPVLTKAEASILFDAAGNMRDDFLDYFGSMVGEKKARKMEVVYQNGMDKLSDIAHSKEIETEKQRLEWLTNGLCEFIPVEHRWKASVYLDNFLKEHKIS